MDKILNESHIRIKEKAADWEEAVRKAGAVLVEEGSIRPAYVEKMIQSVKELGPYIVIMPGFALAHAAPCEDVVKSDMALITLDTPVEFGSPNDPVSGAWDVRTVPHIWTLCPGSLKHCLRRRGSI